MRWESKTLPRVNEWVEVWHLSRIVEARWTGHVWLDRDGKTLREITHWRWKSCANS